MKRSEFLKRLGLGIVAIPLANVMVKGSDLVDVEYEEVSKDPEYSLKYAKQMYQDWLHEGWPLRINDLICINNSDDEYLVTTMDTNVATCTPLKDGPVVYATRDDVIIRFSHIKSEL